MPYSLLRKVDNLDRRFGSSDVYYHICLDILGEGAIVNNSVDLLFTQADIEKAAARARKNPEDFLSLNPREGHLSDVFSDLLGG